MFRTRKIRAQAKEEGKTFDDLMEENGGSKFAEREIRLGWRKEKEVVDLDVEAGFEGKDV